MAGPTYRAGIRQRSRQARADYPADPDHVPVSLVYRALGPCDGRAEFYSKLRGSGVLAGYVQRRHYYVSPAARPSVFAAYPGSRRRCCRRWSYAISDSAPGTAQSRVALWLAV